MISKTDLIFMAALGLLAYGSYLIFFPATFLVPGCILLFLVTR